MVYYLELKWNVIFFSKSDWKCSVLKTYHWFVDKVSVKVLHVWDVGTCLSCSTSCGWFVAMFLVLLLLELLLVPRDGLTAFCPVNLGWVYISLKSVAHIMCQEYLFALKLLSLNNAFCEWNIGWLVFISPFFMQSHVCLTCVFINCLFHVLWRKNSGGTERGANQQVL